MAWSPPGSGRLRHKVDFQRLGEGDNDGGVVRTSWAALFSRRCELVVLRGGEEVQAARLAGTSVWQCTIRQDPETRTLTTDDRAVNDAGESLDIRSIDDLEGLGRWFVLTLEKGKGDGLAG